MTSSSVIRLEQSNKAKLTVAVLLIALTSVAVLPFFVIGEDQKVGCCGGAMPVTHDSWMHYNQMNAFWQSLSAGIIYPRWDEHTHGYGAPTTSFYPPGVYYLTSAIYAVTRDWIATWAGFYWLTMLASAAAFYLYARQHLARGPSLLGTTLYVFAPYHLLNQYQRGAMSEFTSFIWIPLCLLYAERLLESDKRQPDRLSVAGLAASFGAFLWMHPPTAYQFLLVFGVCILGRFVVWRFKPATETNVGITNILWLIVGLGFGSLLAAAYFYPAIWEQHLVNSDDVERTWPYHASYVFDYTQTVYDRVNNVFFVRLDRIWAFNAIGIVVLALALVKRAPVAAPVAVPVGLWASAGLLASFLMTRLSAPLGRLIPKIEIGVYSWRMLTLTSFALALLAAASAARLKALAHNHRQSVWSAFRPVAITSMIVGTLGMSAWYVAWAIWRGQSFEPNLQHYNYATMPRGAVRENPPMPPVQLAAGQGSLTITRWTPEFRQLRVWLPVADQLQFRTRNFAGWTATVDGQLVPIHEGPIKNILFAVPAGTHDVTLAYVATPVRRLSNWLSLVSFALLLSIVITQRRTR